MKYWMALTVVALSSAIALAEPIPDYVSTTGAKWKLLWHDEFDTEKLDEKKWTFGLPWAGTDGAHRHHNNLYASYMMEHNLDVGDGKVQLLTRREDVTAKNGKVFHFTQAMIHTDGKFNRKYGYWEVSAKLPAEAGPGLWPAFWTLSRGWPPEMDICEIWTSSNRSHQGMAYREGGRVRWDDYNETTPLPIDWTTYGMEWGPGYQVYFVAGHVKKRVYGDHVTDVEHYILLNSGVESGNPPTPTTVFPNAFEIDYVRVYERPDVPVIHNAGFEDSSPAPWKPYGRCVPVAYGARSGKQALRVDGASGAEQKLYGLKPSTTYVVSGSVRMLTDAGEARLGVKGQGGQEIWHSVTGTGATTAQAEFTTGEQNATATVYCYTPSPDAAAIFDDLSLRAK
jgi:beta-glucanase (GH16 family)